MRFDTAVPQAQPAFVVLFGAQGMGKGAVLRRWATQNATLNYCHINVDAIVQSLPVYLQYVGEIMAELDPAYLDHAVDDARYWADLLARSAAKLDLLYQGLRAAVANQVSDLWLDRAFLQRYTIAWETTGAYLNVTRRQLRSAQARQYATRLLYPISSIRTAKRRAVKRFALTRAVANVGRIANVADRAQRNLRRLLGSGLVDEALFIDNTAEDGESNGFDIVASVRLTPLSSAHCSCPRLRRVTAALVDEGDEEAQADLLRLLRDYCWECEPP
eukprot:EG_transcript_17301